MPTRVFTGAVSIAHQWVAQVLKPGMIAVDATAGNGRDTLFLARLVGKTGKIYAFDIQEEALRKTRLLLETHGAFAQVRLIKDSHENLGTYIDEPVTVIMFNLGYLPGGNKKIVTRPETTLGALQ
ncbi:MAG TPA: methyltransferase domain-containing protein, partial [Clostridia bacterium]|nr:methyltransferase domain-containing protein [Clostridia bacterium]